MGELYGLIGYPISHSFSKQYFEKKFKAENISGCSYQLFELMQIQQIEELIQSKAELKGLNVTIPFKETIIPYLDSMDESAEKVGAVNVIKIEGGKLIGYNSDIYGFHNSLLKLLPSDFSEVSGIILGNGGSAKAVRTVLNVLGISNITVSRKPSENVITYNDLADSTQIEKAKLIVNTTPLGMTPNIENYPDIPYDQVTSSHFLFDLIYNPTETLFLKKGGELGAQAKNGLEMLELQAERSWEIWNS